MHFLNLNAFNLHRYLTDEYLHYRCFVEQKNQGLGKEVMWSSTSSSSDRPGGLVPESYDLNYSIMN